MPSSGSTVSGSIQRRRAARRKILRLDRRAPMLLNLPTRTGHQPDRPKIRTPQSLLRCCPLLPPSPAGRSSHTSASEPLKRDSGRSTRLIRKSSGSWSFRWSSPLVSERSTSFGTGTKRAARLVRRIARSGVSLTLRIHPLRLIARPNNGEWHRSGGWFIVEHQVLFDASGYRLRAAASDPYEVKNQWQPRTKS